MVESPALKALKEGLIIGLANHTVLIAKDGSELPIDDSAAPIVSEGRIGGAVLVFRDISEKKRAETEKHRLLLEVETERSRLAEVFQHAPSFLCVLRGPAHVFERANDQYRQLVGGRDLLGKPVREALPEVEGQGFFEILDRVLATGEPFIGSDVRITLQRGEGMEERFLDFVYQPLREADGTVTGIVVQGIDLTDRKRAEQALARVTAESERQKRMYDTALSNTADFVYLFDLEGRFTYVNKSLLDLWKKDLSEAVGKNFHELDYPDDLATRLQQQIKQVIHSRQPLRDETPYTSASGTRAYEYIFVPVFGAGGEVEAVAGSTREITERKQSEERLSASEERYRVLVTANSDVVYRMSADWSELYPLNGRDLVASNTEPIRNWLEKNLPPFEHARVRAAIEQAISTRQTFEMEHQVIGVDGALGWTLSRAAPILDSAGNIVEWFGTARDVTALKRTESDLVDIRSRMEAALSAGAIGTWAWDIPSDRFYADASLAAIFSVAPEDVAGGSLARIMNAIHPDDRDRVADQIEKAITSGARYEADYRVAQKDGSWRWITARGQVERDARGQAVRFPGVVIDVTDRKIAEEALAHLTALSEQRKRLYETTLSNTPDLVYVFDRNHRFVYANEALLAMWGRTWDEAIGKTCLELGYELWHASMHDREIEQVVSTRQPIRGVVPFTGSKGRRDYDYIFVPVLGADGEVEAVAGTTRDVTDQKAASEALRESDRKKDDFIALLAHELRNPLAPIRNGLQVIRLSSEPSIRDQVQQMMDRQLSHMVRMIDDLLDVSRIGRHKMELRRERVALNDVINSAVETARPAIEEAGHDLSLELPQEPIFLDADLTRLSQVFSNLLVNSAKYTERGGRIWLAAKKNQNEIAVSVRDTGIGIPPDSLSAIFDMFSQIDRPLERKTGGLGIGLALVKGLVEIHGGSVTAYSQGPGSGSTFTVTLPLLVEANEVATSDRNQGQIPVAPKRKVLVVDDNHDGALSLAMMLKLTGNDVAMAHDGLEAIEQAERFRPDCILMDMGMPKLNGLEAAKRIREMAWSRDIVIIALTGWGQDADRELTRQAGCDGHLVKPVSLDDLQIMLNELGSR